MGPCQICIKFHHGRSVLSVLPAAPRIQPPLSMQPTHHGFRSGPRWPRMFQRNRGPKVDLSWPRAGKIKAIVHTPRVVRVILALWPCESSLYLWGAAAQRDHIYCKTVEMKSAGRTPYSTSGLAMVAESQFCITMQSFAEVVFRVDEQPPQGSLPDMYQMSSWQADQF